MMSLHKLTAGDGYTYLTRQVAADDGTERGYDSLGDYYAQKGESPGVWMGRGLVGLSDFPPGFLLPGFTPVDRSVGGHAVTAGQVVTEAQMVALFGEGRHPNAEQLEALLLADGHRTDVILAATRLGKPFLVYEGASAFRRRVAVRMVEYNRLIGAARGSPVPPEQRARIRTQFADNMFREEFGREPLDARERSGFLARVSRQRTTAVAGYDLTFSPVKSVSALWAVAPVEVSRVIEGAHREAVADTLSWLENSAAYTRLGRAGVRQVDVKGLIAAAFEHRDSRAGDPDLHTHLAVSNKVQTIDGRWLALDGRTLYRTAVAASERYNTRLEAFLVDRLGVTFAERAGVQASKRAVREIVGMPMELLAAWSARRTAIEKRRGYLATQFQAAHGRPPSAVEAIHLAQQATLETRQAKHVPRSLAEQRSAWREQAIQVLGGRPEFDALLARFSPVSSSEVETDHRKGRLFRKWRSGSATEPVAALGQEWVTDTAARVVAIVESGRATWQESHVRAEAERQIRAAAVPLTVLEELVELVVEAAMSPRQSIRLDRPADVTPAVTPDPDDVSPRGDRTRDVLCVPAALLRQDGTSVYETAGAALHTSAAVLAAEQQILDIAGRRDAPALTVAQIDLALLESAANGLALNPGQAQLVRDLAGSGSRLQLALAPAGTGKTTAMTVLARAWNDAGGTVLGLAPSAVAAAELRKALPGAHTDTLAKLTHSLNTGLEAQPSGPGRAPLRPARIPDWVRQIGPGTLVIIDEAGMAGTVELSQVIQAVTDVGATVRLIGDDQQLAAIGAGGVLRDVAHHHGAATLRDTVRFSDPVEGAASLALRTGGSTAIGFYLDHERIHVGDSATAIEQAYTAWQSDRNAGRDAVLLAPTRELAAALNLRARTDRLAAVPVLAGRVRQGTAEAAKGREVRLSDGSSVSAGDTIITRRNNRRLPITATDWVKNGHRWHVVTVTGDGALHVRHLATGRRIVLPAQYAQEHVQLGYASTIHAAQGLTADTCHTVATSTDLSRQLLYVAMSRGRYGNHLYLNVAGDGNEHTAITRDALLPPTAADELLRILNRDDGQISATTTMGELADPVLRLQHAAARYHDAVLAGAESTLELQALELIEQRAERLLPGLTSSPAWPTLRSQLALISLDGHDPIAALREAIDYRDLDTAEDLAAVLDWRLDSTQRRTADPAPLPWQPGIPAALKTDTVWGPYLQARAQLANVLVQAVASTTTAWTPTTAPPWATHLLGRHQDQLIADLAIWRATQAIPDTELHPPGPPPGPAAEARHHQDLSRRVADLLGDPAAATARWRPLLDPWAPTVLKDPFWPRLATHLDTAHRAGIDVGALLTSVTADGRPLPDEHPASALWWRLSRTLTPAVLASAEAASVAHRPEPAPLLPRSWTPSMDTVLGSAADRVRADPEWPALVTAIDDGQLQGWLPEQLLAAAQDQLYAASSDVALPLAELTSALTRSVRSLIDLRAASEPIPVSELREPELEDDVPPDPDHLPPPDLHERPRSPINQPRRPRPTAPTPPPSRVPAPAGPPRVAAQRIADLNDAAMDYFRRGYRASWAPAYLNERLGLSPSTTGPTNDETELLADDTVAGFRVGYAPMGWTSLYAHLRSHGASDEELLAAGLVTRARTGRLIDRFRDRMVFPIRANIPGDGQAGRIVGFVGRRNPANEQASPEAEAADGHVPKYVNTASTAAFSKAATLFGLIEAAPALRAGAIPVLVEGPLDAIAVTLAGDGRYVGIPLLGTAFTDAQARLLLSHIPSLAANAGLGGGGQGTGEPRHGVLVATDGDGAGQAAAERAYWAMAGRSRSDIGQINLPVGTDPAQILADQGSSALLAMLDTATDLSAHLVDARITALADELGTVEGRIQALRLAATVISSQHPSSWSAGIRDLSERLDVLPETAGWEVAQAIHLWNDDPEGQARVAAATTFLSPPITPEATTTERIADAGIQALRRSPHTVNHRTEPPSLARRGREARPR